MNPHVLLKHRPKEEHWTIPEKFVHIVDDDEAAGKATSLLLRKHGIHSDIYVSGRDLVENARLDLGVVLLDLKSKEAATLEILETLCNGKCPLPVVFVTDVCDLEAAVMAMKLGAIDVIERPYDWLHLVVVLKYAFKVRAAETKQSAAEVSATRKVKGLTPRQRQILQGVVAGLANKVMARRLALSPRTVEMHRARMLDRLSVSNISDAIRVANYACLPALESQSKAT